MTQDPHTHIFAAYPLPAFSVISLASLAVHLLLPVATSHVLAVTLLTMIAGIYVGFAVADGRGSRIWVESAVACFFVAFVTWSLVNAPELIPAGYLAHAAWDFAHHTPLFKVAMPKWYIPACVVVDVIVDLVLWLIWAL